MIYTCSFSATAATLQESRELPTGMYDVLIDIRDQQGYGKTQTTKVRICHCANKVCLPKQRSVTLGPLALLATLLPLALLLLLGESPAAKLPPTESRRPHSVQTVNRDF